MCDMTRLQGRTHKLHGVTTVCSCVCDMTHPAALHFYGLLMCGMPHLSVLCGMTHSYVMCGNDKFEGWCTDAALRFHERWGAGVETQKNVRSEAGGWGRVPFNEPYAPS